MIKFASTGSLVAKKSRAMVGPVTGTGDWGSGTRDSGGLKTGFG